MTDQAEALPEPNWDMPDPAPGGDWGDAHPLERRPQALDGDSKLANHLITISFTPKGQPMVVVRGNSAVEITGLLEELDAEGVYIQLAQAQHTLVNSAPPAETVMRQLGATPVGQYPPAQAGPPTMAQQYPTPQGGFAGPPVPSPGQPPFGAPAGGYTPPQQGGWGAPPAAPVRPQGWYAVKIPWTAKAEGDQLKDTLKAQGLYQGNMKWEKATSTWLVSPAIVNYFGQWNPTPA